MSRRGAQRDGHRIGRCRGQQAGRQSGKAEPEGESRDQQEAAAMNERHLVETMGLSSDLRHAAVDRDLSAGNEAALVACKEESCGGDLLGAGEAS
jgi:hypothetical protein